MGSERPNSGRTPLSPLPILRTTARRASLVAALAVVASSCTPEERAPPTSDVIVDETYPAPAPEPPAEPDTIGAVPIEALSTRPRLINAAEMGQAQRRLYPPRLLEAGVGGSSVVRVVIDERGTPVDVTLERSSTHQQLDEASLQLARLARFRPGECRGVAVRAHFPLPVGWHPRIDPAPPLDTVEPPEKGRTGFEGVGIGAPPEGPCARDPA
jgi:protein TonB